jgi:hypothetical protein
MSNREVGSLDRFITTRAPALAGWIDPRRRVRALGIVSGAYGVIGIGSLIGALAAGGGPPSLALFGQSVLFLAGSGIIAGVRSWLKQRAGAETALPIPLTPEAKELVRSLVTHLEGWPLGRRRLRHRLRRLMQQGVTRTAHDRRCEDVLSPEAFALLESAAHAANRVYGALAAEDCPANSTLARLAPTIYAAADETMAEMLDLAARCDRYPESGAQAQGQSQIEELNALADRVERLQATVDSAETAAPDVSRIQAVLKELHADERAREELQQTVEPAGPEAPQVNLTSGTM